MNLDLVRVPLGARGSFRGSLENVFDLCGQVFKSTRWMPWHQEPKKDVGICDKPGGVDNRTVIPGCPNGETPPDAFCVIW